MDRSINSYLKGFQQISEWVWLDETVAVKQGQGLCYEYAYGTAASVDGRRRNYVKLPTVANANWFAGVAAADYAACATGQLIEIYVPGSVCLVLTKKSLTVGVSRVTCCYDATANTSTLGAYNGYFMAEGFPGRGSAKPLQTLDTSTTAAKTLCYLEDGAESGLAELITSTAGGAFVPLVGGATHFSTNTIAANLTNTPAAGTLIGQRKKWVVDGTQTTSSVVVTYGGTAVRLDGSTTLASLTMETTNDESTLEWTGIAWRQLSNYAITPA
jgi:hypothetical protein